MISFAKSLVETFQNHKLTDTIAGLSVVSPFWLPSLASISQTAALLMPILGAAWLITQIYQAWFRSKRK